MSGGRELVLKAQLPPQTTHRRLQGTGRAGAPDALYDLYTLTDRLAAMRGQILVSYSPRAGIRYATWTRRRCRPPRRRQAWARGGKTADFYSAARDACQPATRGRFEGKTADFHSAARGRRAAIVPAPSVPASQRGDLNSYQCAGALNLHGRHGGTGGGGVEEGGGGAARRWLIAVFMQGSRPAPAPRRLRHIRNGDRRDPGSWARWAAAAAPCTCRLCRIPAAGAVVAGPPDPARRRCAPPHAPMHYE